MIELAHKKNNAFIGMKSTYSIEFNVKVECFLPSKNIILYNNIEGWFCSWAYHYYSAWIDKVQL